MKGRMQTPVGVIELELTADELKSILSGPAVVRANKIIRRTYRHHMWNEDEKNAVKKLISTGASRKKVARQMGVTLSSINALVKRHFPEFCRKRSPNGAKNHITKNGTHDKRIPLPYHWQPSEVSTLMDMVEKGKTMKEISAVIGRTTQAIHSKLDGIRSKANLKSMKADGED